MNIGFWRGWETIEAQFSGLIESSDQPTSKSKTKELSQNAFYSMRLEFKVCTFLGFPFYPTTRAYANRVARAHHLSFSRHFCLRSTTPPFHHTDSLPEALAFAYKAIDQQISGTDPTYDLTANTRLRS